MNRYSDGRITQQLLVAGKGNLEITFSPSVTSLFCLSVFVFNPLLIDANDNPALIVFDPVSLMPSSLIHFQSNAKCAAVPQVVAVNTKS